MWNCCKPSCSWPGKASVSNPVASCYKENSGFNIARADQPSGCDNGGYTYTCTNQQPWAVNDTFSYGFAGVSLASANQDLQCSSCYQLDFTADSVLSGKSMIVQIVNSGTRPGSAQFDLQIPGILAFVFYNDTFRRRRE